MRRRREIPDARIVAFPDNHRGDDSPAAHRATWGPNHDTPPLGIGNFLLIERKGLIARFSVHVVHRYGSGLGYWLHGCRLVRWGAGERVFPPQDSKKVVKIAVSDDGEETVISIKPDWTEVFEFDSNRGAKAFEEAVLAAVRPVLARHRSDQPAPSATFVDDGDTDVDDVPF